MRASVAPADQRFPGKHPDPLLLTKLLPLEATRPEAAPSALLNDLAGVSSAMTLILDDYHVVDASQLMLEYLERASLFLKPLDEERSGFRYHQLFADAREAHLRLHDPEQMVALHRRAAACWQQRTLPPRRSGTPWSPTTTPSPPG